MVDQPIHDPRSQAPTAGEPPDPSPARPRVVTMAGMILLLTPLVGVVGLLAAVIALIVAWDNAAEVADRLRGQGYGDVRPLVDDLLSALWVQLGVSAVVKLLQAAGLGVLGLFVLRGSRGGRIAAYVVAGLITVGAIGLGILDWIRQGLRNSLSGISPDAGMVFVDETDLLPGWYQPINYVTLVASVLAMAVVVWLLSRPTSNAYFRGGPHVPVRAVPAAEPGSGLPIQTGPLAASVPPTAAPPPPTLSAPPEPPGPAARPVSPPRAWYRRPHVIGGGAIVVLAGTILCVAVASDSRSPDTPAPDITPEPAHRVSYQVSTSDRADSDVEIDYSSERGDLVADKVPGFTRQWSKELTTDPGTRFIALVARADSLDRIACTVTVDGRVAGTDSRPFVCQIRLDLRTVRLASGPPLAPPPSPTPSSPAPTSTKPVPPACRYVTVAEATDILFRQIGDRHLRPVLAVSGDERECTYFFSRQRLAAITFSWRPGGKIPVANVPGFGVPAYAIPLPSGAKVEVQLPNGVFTVDTVFQTFPVDDPVNVAIEVFKVARPRLPTG